MDTPIIDASASMSLLGTGPEAIDRRLEAMAALGVELSVLVADRRGPSDGHHTPAVDPADVLAAAQSHPNRLVPALGVEPVGAKGDLGSLRATFEGGFRVAHLVPHAFGAPPDDRRWYPIYGLCSELGIPVQVELGVRRSPGVRVRSVGRPIALDSVACDFPELPILGVGAWPWVEEAISMAYKHPNLRLTIGSDDPLAPHPSLARFADSWGVGSVLFASGGSDLQNSIWRVDQLRLRPESAQACLHDAAAGHLGLDRDQGRGA